MTGTFLIGVGVLLTGVGVVMLLIAVFGPGTVGRHRNNRPWERGLPTADPDPTAVEQMRVAAIPDNWRRLPAEEQTNSTEEL